jgi:glyoxylase-like metal-dependent hydrolase (beta-lactamase superfamily II)
MEFFTSEKVSPSITRIFGLSGELMYLVEGASRAMLIDTGIGAGNLKAYVESLTELPYDVVHTHGHLDHTGGSALFEGKTLYLNKADWEMAKRPSVEGRLASAVNPNRPEEPKREVTLADMAPDAVLDYTDLNDGDAFDLGGGITLEALALPGHTLGSMAIWFPAEGSVLLGDACNFFTFLFLPESLSVTAYREELLKFKTAHRAKYSRVYLSHGDGNGLPDMVESVIGVCDDILAGKTDDVPFEFMGRKGNAFIAKKVDFAAMGKGEAPQGNIVYNKDKIR